MQRRQTVLVYGVTGVGKTTFAATAQHPIKYIDIEARAQNIHPDDLKGIDFESPTTSADVQAIYNGLKTSTNSKYQTIIIDSLRELQRIVIDEYKKQYAGDKDKFTVWDKAHSKMHNIIRAFRDFPKLHGADLVVTCPAFDSKDEDSLEQVPLLEGADKFVKEIMGLFDCIFYVKPYYNGTNMEYKLVTRDTGKIRAKNPSRTLQTVLDITEGKADRWTLESVLNHINNPVTKEVSSEEISKGGRN